jgi:malonyl-CoA O-methyltransferase
MDGSDNVDNNNAAFYDADSRRYDDQRFADPVGRRETDRLHGLLRQEMHGRYANGLEIGPGTGRATAIIIEHVDALTLVDVSTGMLDVARETTAASRSIVETQVGSVLNLPFEAEVFDIVVTINVLSHVDDMRRAVAELGRVTRTAGQVLFSTPSLSSAYAPAGFMINRRHRAIGQDVYSHWPSKAAVRSWIQEAGLTLTGVHGMYFAPRAVRKVPLATPVVTMLDRLAERSSLVSRTSPWLLWSCIRST